jgi:hypothetical protein
LKSTGKQDFIFFNKKRIRGSNHFKPLSSHKRSIAETVEIEV